MALNYATFSDNILQQHDSLPFTGQTTSMTMTSSPNPLPAATDDEIDNDVASIASQMDSMSVHTSRASSPQVLGQAGAAARMRSPPGLGGPSIAAPCAVGQPVTCSAMASAIAMASTVTTVFATVSEQQPQTTDKTTSSISLSVTSAVRVAASFAADQPQSAVHSPGGDVRLTAQAAATNICQHVVAAISAQQSPLRPSPLSTTADADSRPTTPPTASAVQPGANILTQALMEAAACMYGAMPKLPHGAPDGAPVSAPTCAPVDQVAGAAAAAASASAPTSPVKSYVPTARPATPAPVLSAAPVSGSPASQALRQLHEAGDLDDLLACDNDLRTGRDDRRRAAAALDEMCSLPILPRQIMEVHLPRAQFSLLPPRPTTKLDMKLKRQSYVYVPVSSPAVLVLLEARQAETQQRLEAFVASNTTELVMDQWAPSSALVINAVDYDHVLRAHLSSKAAQFPRLNQLTAKFKAQLDADFAYEITDKRMRMYEELARTLLQQLAALETTAQSTFRLVKSIEGNDPIKQALLGTALPKLMQPIMDATVIGVELLVQLTSARQQAVLRVFKAEAAECVTHLCKSLQQSNHLF